MKHGFEAKWDINVAVGVIQLTAVSYLLNEDGVAQLIADYEGKRVFQTPEQLVKSFLQEGYTWESDGTNLIVVKQIGSNSFREFLVPIEWLESAGYDAYGLLKDKLVINDKGDKVCQK